jgi:hypothetical protein
LLFGVGVLSALCVPFAYSLGDYFYLHPELRRLGTVFVALAWSGIFTCPAGYAQWRALRTCRRSTCTLAAVIVALAGIALGIVTTLFLVEDLNESPRDWGGIIQCLAFLLLTAAMLATAFVTALWSAALPARSTSDGRE